MDTSSVGEIDGWIEKLYNCKPLSEQEIRRLCEKVRLVKLETQTEPKLSPRVGRAAPPENSLPC